MHDTSWIDSINYKVNKAKEISIAKSQIAYSKLSKKKLGLVGAYARLNVGDMALGQSIQNIAEVNQISTVLKCINYYSSYSDTEYTILGGGAIANQNNLSRLINWSKKDFSKVGLLGVDFYGDLSSLSRETVEFLREIKFISSRHFLKEDQKKILKHNLGRDDVSFHPDLAFSLYSHRSLSKSKDKKILGINMLPWLFSLQGGRWSYTDYSRSHYGQQIKQSVDYKTLGSAYINLFQSVVDYYYRLGYEIRHIPFAVEDDLFAKSFLDKSKVYFCRYSANPETVLTEISKLSLMIATRFHAHVFSFIQQTPLISIGYSSKCENLLKHIGLDTDSQINCLFLDSNKNKNMDLFHSLKPIIVHEEKLEMLANSVTSSVSRLINEWSK